MFRKGDLHLQAEEALLDKIKDLASEVESTSIADLAYAYSLVVGHGRRKR